MSDQTVLKAPAADSGFERKVRASGLVLLLERMWPRLWLALGIVILFIVLSMAGVWPLLPGWLHKLALAALAVALLAALASALRIPMPARDESIRRMERVSGLPHRPASSYEDTLSNAGHQEPETRALWAAHRKRLAAMLERLRVGSPEPRTDRLDPFALRAALLLSAVTLTALVGDSASDRLAAAFRFGASGVASGARIDAWVAPPAYTGKPPIMLADGSGAAPKGAVAEGGAIVVPARSVLVVRGIGKEGLKLQAAFTPAPPVDGVPTEPASSTESKAANAAGEPSELKFEIKAAGTVRATANGSTVGSWTFDVIPDQLPRITLTKVPEPSPRGALKLTYKVEDDYGVASAEARFEKVRPKAADPAKAWAREELKGPRRPLERPPVMALRLPRPNAKDGEAQTHLELGSHQWAGLEVRMQLTAKDVGGQVGKSATMDMVMPGRVFRKPLARAVVEQRRKLIDDSRARGQVLRALAALTIEPDGFMDSHAYLGLRSAYHRLQRDKTRAGMKSVTAQLWHVALRIEDGDLSDAERALREAQEKLSKALENGASDQEIQQLMQEMRQALNNYMEQMQKQAEGQQMQPGQDQNRQMLSSQDLERMMKNIENMAKNGSREQAQQMLSEMRDLMERLQAGRMNPEQQQQSQQQMQKMDELGNIVGDQQKLMDETFNEQRNQGDQQQQQQGQQGQKGQQGQPGQRNKGQQQQQGRNGQNRPGQQGQPGQQQGQQGQGGQQQQGQGRGDQTGQLGQRQGSLRDKLDQLQKDMNELGMGSDKLDAAREAMGSAEQALKEGDLEGATAEQGRALDKMREGARQMAQEMTKGMPNRYGQSGDTPRDPMGRPQKSQGPDLGTSVKVPDEIDMQRAREILEELRRRSGEATRPQQELDYLDRLLRRF